MVPETEFEAQKVHLCTEGLDAFEDCLDELDLDGLTISAGQSDPNQMEFAGVNVSVRPEIVLVGEDRAEVEAAPAQARLHGEIKRRTRAVGALGWNAILHLSP